MQTLRSKTAAVFTAALLVGCVVAAVGFVLGRDSADPTPVQASGAAHPKRVAEARRAGYERGFAAGRRAAERRQARDDAGESKPSGTDALAVDDLDLEPGSYYIVRVAEGDSGAEIDDYAPMQPGVSYELCADYGVCRRVPGSP